MIDILALDLERAVVMSPRHYYWRGKPFSCGASISSARKEFSREVCVYRYIYVAYYS